MADPVELLAEHHAQRALLARPEVDLGSSVRKTVVADDCDVALAPVDLGPKIVVDLDELLKLVTGELGVVAKRHVERALGKWKMLHERPRVEPHAVIGEAGVEQIAIELREVLERRIVEPRLHEAIRAPLDQETSLDRLGFGDGGVIGAERLLPVVVDAVPDLSDEVLGIGEAAVIADAVRLEFLTKLGCENRVGGGNAIGDVGRAPIGKCVGADEADQPSALADIGHLVVEGETGGERSADLVHVGLDPVSRISAAFVDHLGVEHNLGELAHRSDAGQSRVPQHDEADRVKRGPHASSEFAAGLQIGIVHLEVRTVDFVHLGSVV